MRTIGIAMLFGLCCMIGFRLGMKKTAQLKTVRSIQSDLQLFSERITTESGTLEELACQMNGTLSKILRAYLDALRLGKRESEAAEYASTDLRVYENLQTGLLRFLTGLSTAARGDLIGRTQALITVTKQAEAQAEAEADRARVLRITGVLTGAGLAILLL